MLKKSVAVCVWGGGEVCVGGGGSGRQGEVGSMQCFERI